MEINETKLDWEDETDRKIFFAAITEHFEDQLHSKDKKLFKWASLINSLACIILDGDPSSNDIDLAEDAIKEVLPYLGGDHGH
jgi:hypothetical protein